MKFKTTWILIAMLAGIVAYYFLVEAKNHESKNRERREMRKLFPYESRDVERFILANPKGERVEVERAGSSWKVVAPVAAPPDEPAILSFLHQIVPGKRGEELPNVANFADYGLEKPFATLILYRRGASAPDTLRVGDKTPTGPNCYVRIGSSKSVLISADLTHNVMNRGLLHFRDKNFLSFEGDAVDALAIRAGAEKMQIAKVGDEWWFAGFHARADRRKVQSYLTQLARAVVRQFVREDLDSLAQYGLEAPANELTLSRGAETTRIAFGTKAGDEVYARRTGLDKVIRLEARFLEPFNWNTENLRAMNLAFFQVDSVKAIRYETPDADVVLGKTGNTWRASGADAHAIQSSEIGPFLQALNSVTFERIVAGPLASGEAKLSKFTLRVTLEDSKGIVLDRITLAAPSNGNELGGSISANAVGSLAKGTSDRINTMFKRIGVHR